MLFKVLKFGFHLIIILFIIAATAFGVYHYMSQSYNDLNAKYTALQTENTELQAEYAGAINDKEQALIDKAEAEKVANTPVTAQVQTQTTAQIQYVEKETPADPDVKVTNTQAPIVVSYNGQTESLPTTTTQGKAITNGNGQVVVTQNSTATLNIDSIVNRQIANTVDTYKHQQQVLERQKTQHAFWGVVGGFVLRAVIF